MSRARPILVVPGALGSAAQMATVAKGLTALGDPAVVELPGHGQTPLQSGSVFGMDLFVDAIAAAVARAGASSSAETLSPVVFGYSMSDYATLVLEARAPGTFAGIVTLGSKFEWTPKLAVKEAGRLDADVTSAKVPRFADTLALRHERS